MNAFKAKLGPFPRWVWLALLVAAVYLWYRHKNSSAGSALSSTAVATPSAPPSGTADLSSLGSPSSAGTTDSGAANAATSDLLSAYGSSQQNLLDALLQTQANVVGLAQNQASSAQSQQYAQQPDTAPSGTAVAPVTNNYYSTSKPQPGTGNAPTVTHAAPAVPTRYYTYAPGKAPKGRTADQAPTAKGLKFASGKGYYY